MSRGNVEIVRSIYEAFNRRDWDAAFRDQHPDAEMTTPPGPNAPNPETSRGRAEIQGVLEEWLTPWEALTAEPEEFFEHGDQVVAVVKGRARPKGSSAEIENRTGDLWTLRDGAVVSMRLFPQPEKALEAAGLENVQIVRRIYKAFNRGDFDAAARGLHPDFEFTRPGVESPVRGVAAMRAWMEPDAFEAQRFEPFDFTVQGSTVFVRQHATGRGAGSGMELDAINFAVITLDDDGLVTRLQGFAPHEEAEALEAAGLSE